MKKLFVFLLTLPSFGVFAQSKTCSCFTGIGSDARDTPRMTITFYEGTTLSVCGFEDEKISENEIWISEFNVVNCQTGESLAEYGALQTCLVKKDVIGLQITEFTFLPAGDNWEWVNVKIGFQQIFVKENELIVLKQVPAFETTAIDTVQADLFLSATRDLKGTGKIENPEELLGRLEFLALNGFRETADILNDFENYFKYQTDGAIAEQWKDAAARLKWIAAS
jgi:hypothetical protein